MTHPIVIAEAETIDAIAANPAWFPDDARLIRAEHATIAIERVAMHFLAPTMSCSELPDDVAERCQAMSSVNLLDHTLQVFVRAMINGKSSDATAAQAYRSELLNRLDARRVYVIVEGEKTGEHVLRAARSENRATAIASKYNAHLTGDGPYLVHAVDLDVGAFEASLPHLQPSPAGQGDARALFEAWARPRFQGAEAFDRIDGRSNGWEYNGKTVQAAWAGWQAALAARQPATDELYANEQALIDHLDALMDDGGQGGGKWEPAQAAIRGIIAARLPVGQEPVGYFDPDVLAHLTDGMIDPVGVLRRKPNATSNVPVWMGPPAQSVDLAGLEEIIDDLTQSTGVDDYEAHQIAYIEGIRDRLRALVNGAARQPVADQHPDDLAVDAFAAAMKSKMAAARAKGRGGWEDPTQCSADDLSRMLRDHLVKGDPRDVANICMMLHQRGEPIMSPAVQVPDNEIVRNILGRPNFACVQLADMLRDHGHSIPPKAESEQAAVLLFMLNCYLELPDRWHDNMREKLRRMKAAANGDACSQAGVARG